MNIDSLLFDTLLSLYSCVMYCKDIQGDVRRSVYLYILQGKKLC
jgi:hypothetical protein